VSPYDRYAYWFPFIEKNKEKLPRKLQKAKIQTKWDSAIHTLLDQSTHSQYSSFFVLILKLTFKSNRTLLTLDLSSMDISFIPKTVQALKIVTNLQKVILAHNKITNCHYYDKYIAREFGLVCVFPFLQKS
jgi:hypothetical protein